MRQLLSLLLINQHILLPFAWRFVGAVDASSPAAGALFAFQQFLARALDAALACGGLFGVIDPADKFITTQGREILPERKNIRVRLNRRTHIILRFVHGAVEEITGHGLVMS